ncbi:MAG TPA: NADH-quinone oxidoreductase subunit J [Vicinamibacterales bacterium]|jgi:NADH-quinone oxidoreductase subunit J|nr:NADH-quinone oxidoreductase subunit J [Vicinamibacterales bacterium]
MVPIFYVSAAVAFLATALAISRANVVHGLLDLIVSLLAVAVMFLTLGAPFLAALEVIIYAGAIMVLFVFVMMLLNLGPQTVEQERRWLPPRAWITPFVLAAVLLVEVVVVLGGVDGPALAGEAIDPRQLGTVLFGRYAIGVELASMLLLAGVVGAAHLGRREGGA